MTTGPHGLEALSGFLPLRSPVSDAIFGAITNPLLYLNAGAAIIWKGRLEDLSHERNGLRWAAYGPFRWFSDYLYNYIWSTQDLSGVTSCTIDMGSVYDDAKFVLDKNNRIFIGLKKNETYASGGSSEIGAQVFYDNHVMGGLIKRVEFDYDVVMPSSNWVARIRSYTEGFIGGTTEWSRTSSGSGSAVVTLTNERSLIVFEFYNNTGSGVNFTGESGSDYAKFTNLRFKLVDQATITASDVAKGILGFLDFVTVDRISGSEALIEATTEDLIEASWADTYMDDVLRDLAATNDAAADPVQYDVGMWNDNLHFRPKGTESITWLAEVNKRSYNRSLAAMRNNVYALYRSESGNRILRTTAQNDTASIDRWDIIRQDHVRENTTDPAQAADNRDMYLKESAEPPLRVAFDIDRIYLPGGGGPVPLWMVRAGDKIIIRDGVRVPAVIGEDFYQVTLARTALDLDKMKLSVTPEAGSLTLAMGMAKVSLQAQSIGPLKQQRYQDSVRRVYR